MVSSVRFVSRSIINTQQNRIRSICSRTPVWLMCCEVGMTAPSHDLRNSTLASHHRLERLEASSHRDTTEEQRAALESCCSRLNYIHLAHQRHMIDWLDSSFKSPDKTYWPQRYRSFQSFTKRYNFCDVFPRNPYLKQKTKFLSTSCSQFSTVVQHDFPLEIN